MGQQAKQTKPATVANVSKITIMFSFVVVVASSYAPIV